MVSVKGLKFRVSGSGSVVSPAQAGKITTDEKDATAREPETPP